MVIFTCAVQVVYNCLHMHKTELIYVRIRALHTYIMNVINTDISFSTVHSYVVKVLNHVLCHYK